MIGPTGPTAGNHGNVDRAANRAGQGNVITFLGAVAIHGGEQNLTSPELFHFFGPFDGVKSRINPPTAHINIPAITARRPIFTLAAAGINSDHNTLATKTFGSFADQLRIAHRSTVDTDLVRPSQQQRPHIIDGTNAPTDGERDKNGVRHPAHHIDHDIARFVGGGDIEKDQFVGPFAVINLRLGDGVAGVDQVDKIYPFDDPTIFHIKTGNNPFCQHNHLCFQRG